MAKLATVSVRSVRRVEAEVTVTSTDLPAERERRGIGRPSKAEPFRPVVAELLATEPELLSVEILRRAKLKGYLGGKSALYDLIQEVRPTTVRPMVRFCFALPRSTTLAKWTSASWTGRGSGFSSSRRA